MKEPFKNFEISTPPKPQYTTLRMWIGTRDKFKLLANHFDVSMVIFLESLASHMVDHYLSPETTREIDNDQELEVDPEL